LRHIDLKDKGHSAFLDGTNYKKFMFEFYDKDNLQKILDKFFNKFS
jgi:hypothetical protein